jgi:hypothetical protein
MRHQPLGQSAANGRCIPSYLLWCTAFVRVMAAASVPPRLPVLGRGRGHRKAARQLGRRHLREASHDCGEQRTLGDAGGDQARERDY